MRLSLEQIISYQTEGYLIVPDVLDGKDLRRSSKSWSGRSTAARGGCLRRAS